MVGACCSTKILSFSTDAHSHATFAQRQCPFAPLSVLSPRTNLPRVIDSSDQPCRTDRGGQQDAVQPLDPSAAEGVGCCRISPPLAISGALLRAPRKRSPNPWREMPRRWRRAEVPWVRCVYLCAHECEAAAAAVVRKTRPRVCASRRLHRRESKCPNPRVRIGRGATSISGQPAFPLILLLFLLCLSSAPLSRGHLHRGTPTTRHAAPPSHRSLCATPRHHHPHPPLGASFKYAAAVARHPPPQ